MKTSDILKKTGIPRHRFYYLEQKGYIKPLKIPTGELETREYTEADCTIVELIWKYLKMDSSTRRHFLSQWKS